MGILFKSSRKKETKWEKREQPTKTIEKKIKKK